MKVKHGAGERKLFLRIAVFMLSVLLLSNAILPVAANTADDTEIIDSALEIVPEDESNEPAETEEVPEAPETDPETEDTTETETDSETDAETDPETEDPAADDEEESISSNSEEPTPEDPEEAEPVQDPAVTALYDQIMAYTDAESYWEFLDSMTFEEQDALFEQFTDEQLDAIWEHIDALIEYEQAAYAGDPEEIPDFSSVTLVITDNIEKTGRLTVTLQGNLTGYEPVYTWYDQEGNAVVRRDYTNGDIVEYNVEEDGSWLNVAVAQGGKKSYTVKVTGYVTTDEHGDTIYAELPDDNQSSASNPYTVTYSNELLNGSFEQPDIKGKTAADFPDQLYPDNDDYDHDENQMQFLQNEEVEVEGLEWKTTSSCNSIEIINVTNNTLRGDGSYTAGPTFGDHGVLLTVDGEQAAEINSQQAGALYQDVLTIPGTTMYWQLEHMGRPVYGGITENYWPLLLGGSDKGYSKTNPASDTMYVLIMPTELAKNPNINGADGEVDTQEEVDLVMDVYENDPRVQIVPITYQWYWENKGNNTYEMYHYDKNSNQWVLTYTLYDNDNYNDIKVVQHADPWVVSRGEYFVNADTYLTRYFFVAGDTQFNKERPDAADLHYTLGNHIDNISFSIKIPDPVEGSANLEVIKNLEGVAAEDLETVKKNLKFEIEVDEDETLTVYGYDDPEQDELHLVWNGTVGTYAGNFTVSGESGLGYTVTEIITSSNYDLKSVSVKVNNVEVTGNDHIAAGTLTNKETETVTFTNTYTPKTTSVTITKEVKGSMGDVNKEFSFGIAVSGGTMTDETVDATDTSVGYAVKSNVITFSLKNGQSVVIQNVPIGTTFAITEESGVYTMTADNGTVNGSTLTCTVESAAAVEITVTNTYSPTIDTGVTLDSIPYIIVLAAVLPCITLEVVRKRRRFDN